MRVASDGSNRTKRRKRDKGEGSIYSWQPLHPLLLCTSIASEYDEGNAYDVSNRDKDKIVIYRKKMLCENFSALHCIKFSALHRIFRPFLYCDIYFSWEIHICPCKITKYQNYSFRLWTIKYKVKKINKLFSWNLSFVFSDYKLNYLFVLKPIRHSRELLSNSIIELSLYERYSTSLIYSSPPLNKRWKY